MAEKAQKVNDQYLQAEDDIAEKMQSLKEKQARATTEAERQAAAEGIKVLEKLKLMSEQVRVQDRELAEMVLNKQQVDAEAMYRTQGSMRSVMDALKLMDIQMGSLSKAADASVEGVAQRTTAVFQGPAAVL